MTKILVNGKEIQKRKLKHLYLAERMTLVEIAKLYNCDDETIRNYLAKFNIKRRRDAPRYVRSVKKLTPTQAAYFAGIVDGEGTISIIKSTKSVGGLSPKLSVKNTDKKLIGWLMNNIGGKFSSHQPQNPKWKRACEWRLKIAKKANRKPISYPREPNGNFAKAEKMIYDKNFGDAK